jgi:hypothetical protein
MGSWQRLLICLLGFIVARMLVVKLTKKNMNKKYTPNIKTNHET